MHLTKILALFSLLFWSVIGGASDHVKQKKLGNLKNNKYEFSLTEQFKYWQDKGVSIESIEKIRNLDDEKKAQFGLVFFQIIDSHIYYECSSDFSCVRAIKFLDALCPLITKYNLANMYFILYAGDNANMHGQSEITIKSFKETPIFIMSKDSTPGNIEEHMLLLPDIYMFNKKWAKLVESIERTSANQNFEEKIDKIFWRGAATGGNFNCNNYKKFPRGKLVDYSERHPDLIDAKFSNMAQASGDDSGERFKAYFRNKIETVPPEDHLNYKYLVSIDGNTSAWMRVPWILLSNSVLFKQETSETQWFYPGLKPYKHYIPLKENIEDIFEKLKWAKNNQEKVEEIAKESTNFVHNNLLKPHIDKQVVIILNEYAKYQNFTINHPTLKQRYDPCFYGKILSFIYRLKYMFKSKF